MPRDCFCGGARIAGHVHAVVRYSYRDGGHVYVGPYRTAQCAMDAANEHPEDADLLAADVIVVNVPEAVAS